MRRSSKYLLAALVFVAIWGIVAGGATFFREPSTTPAAAAPEALPTDQIVERVARDGNTGSEVISWLGHQGTDIAQSSEAAVSPTEVATVEGPPVATASSPEGANDEPDVRGFDPAPSAPTAGQRTSRSFEEPVPPGVDKPRPIDPNALGDVVERLKQSGENGILTREIPEQMTAFETQRVRIILARQAEAVGMLSDPAVNLKTAAEVPVRDFIKVELYGGKDFKVEPVIDDQGPQSIKRRDRGEWEFDVTPVSGGAHDLEIIVLLYDAPAFLPVAKFSQKITVDVPFGSRLKLFWSGIGGEWFLNFLLAPFLAAIAAAMVAVRVDRFKGLARKRPPSGGEIPPDIHPG